MLRLTLKILADVALVGLPNAGKSSLIAAISPARPKIADYPFTTTTPNLAAINTDDVFSFTMADIPGLVEGAHSGRGLGIRFLQHIQRVKVIVLVLDVSKSASIDASTAGEILIAEMTHFDASLPERIGFVAANKIDLECSETVLNELRDFCRRRGFALFMVSALTGDGLGRFVDSLTSKMSLREAVVGV
jgi:GTP-binding protein